MCPQPTAHESRKDEQVKGNPSSGWHEPLSFATGGVSDDPKQQTSFHARETLP